VADATSNSQVNPTDDCDYTIAHFARLRQGKPAEENVCHGGTPSLIGMLVLMSIEQHLDSLRFTDASDGWPAIVFIGTSQLRVHDCW
jgi:hypothetical protein